MIGKRYGKLIIVDVIKKEDNHYYAICECDCGNKKTIYKSSIVLGKTKSCGCMGYEKTRERKTKISKDIVGEVFGRLTVVEKIGSERLKSGKNKFTFNAMSPSPYCIFCTIRARVRNKCFRLAIWTMHF